MRIPLVGVCTGQAYPTNRSNDRLENRFEPVILPLWQAGDETYPGYLLGRSEGTIGELTTPEDTFRLFCAFPAE